MIVPENITTYMYSLEQDLPEWLEQVRETAIEMKVPVIRREMEPFIRVLLNLTKPRNILEIGTGIGYSALFMSYCRKDAGIVTIENYEPRLEQARAFLSGMENITLLEGDAAKIVKGMEKNADLVFLDGAKGQYITMLPDIIRILNPGGVMLADNILQDGQLVKSRYIMPRRQRTIHSRLRSFVWEATHNPLLDTSLLTIGDGVIFSVRKPG